jgi:hypothetical protein
VHPVARLVGLIGAVALVTGCGAGLNSETQHEKSPIQGANANLGSIQLRDLQIVPAAPGSSTGYLSGELLIANGSDALVSVTASGLTFSFSRTSASPSPTPTGSAVIGSPLGSPSTGKGGHQGGGPSHSASPSPSPTVSAVTSVSMQAGVPVSFALPGVFTGSGISVRITSNSGPLVVGTTPTVSFTFTSGGTLHVAVPINSLVGSTGTAAPPTGTGP